MSEHDSYREEIEYPSIVFKLGGELFSANSKYISTILQLPKYDVLPDAQPHISGVFSYRGQIIAMYDLRSAIGLPSLNEEFREFADMIEIRKQDHVNWVKELKRSIAASEKFTLATDPHKCAFGKWYDHFETDNNMVLYHMRKIDEPHKKLHAAALDVEHCSQQCDTCQREECLKSILERAENEYMETILSLLDEAKDIFHNTIYHEMVLVLSGQHQVGLVVDEVLSVEQLSSYNDRMALDKFQNDAFLSGIKKSDKIEGLIFEVNIPRIRADADLADLKPDLLNLA